LCYYFYCSVYFLLVHVGHVLVLLAANVNYIKCISIRVSLVVVFTEISFLFGAVNINEFLMYITLIGWLS